MQTIWQANNIFIVWCSVFAFCLSSSVLWSLHTILMCMTIWVRIDYRFDSQNNFHQYERQTMNNVKYWTRGTWRQMNSKAASSVCAMQDLSRSLCPVFLLLLIFFDKWELFTFLPCTGKIDSLKMRLKSLLCGFNFVHLGAQLGFIWPQRQSFYLFKMKHNYKSRFLENKILWINPY